MDAAPTWEAPPPANRLAGRRMLITGAASGIGRRTAELFAAEGARVALLDRNEAALAQSVTGGNAAPFTASTLAPRWK